MAKDRKDSNTNDLFEVQNLFPVRAPQTLPRALDFNQRISLAMAEAIKECGKDRTLVAAEMTDLLGYEDSTVTLSMVNAYTSVARETHTISLVRFVAFVRATGCTWLWEVVLHDEGLTLLQGEEALHAQASLAEKHGRQLLDQAKKLRAAAPFQVSRPRTRT